MRSNVRRLAGWSGLTAAALFGLGSLVWWPWGDVRPGAAPAAVAEFYSDSQVRILIGGAVSVVALCLFLVFAAALRELVTPTRRLAGDIALAGAVVTTTAGLAAETINMGGALRAADHPALAKAMYEIPQVFGGYTSSAGLGVFAIAVSASTLLRRGRAWVLRLTGVVLLTPVALFVVEVAGAGLVLVSALVALDVLTLGDTDA